MSIKEEIRAERSEARERENQCTREQISNLVGTAWLTRFSVIWTGLLVFLVLLGSLAVADYLGWISSPWFVFILGFCVLVIFVCTILGEMSKDREVEILRFKHLAESQQAFLSVLRERTDALEEKLDDIVERLGKPWI